MRTRNRNSSVSRLAVLALAWFVAVGTGCTHDFDFLAPCGGPDQACCAGTDAGGATCHAGAGQCTAGMCSCQPGFEACDGHCVAIGRCAGYCGDTYCNAGETCSTCVDDCGSCSEELVCRSCTADSQCSGGQCLWRICDGMAACYATTSSSCPSIEGIQCPAIFDYQTCASDVECGRLSACEGVANITGQRCLHHCTTSDDCVNPVYLNSPLRPSCFTRNSGPVCLLRCSSATTVCPNGMSCRPLADGTTYGHCF